MAKFFCLELPLGPQGLPIAVPGLSPAGLSLCVQTNSGLVSGTEGSFVGKSKWPRGLNSLCFKPSDSVRNKSLILHVEIDTVFLSNLLAVGRGSSALHT